jgi:hypothetical protein
MRRTIFLIFLFFIIGMAAASSLDRFDSPEDVIEDLHKAIERAEEKGEYRCCIEPACTMCYLGSWKFDVGTCYCDDAIAEGRDQDVCPQCKKALEEAGCSAIQTQEAER